MHPTFACGIFAALTTFLYNRREPLACMHAWKNPPRPKHPHGVYDTYLETSNYPFSPSLFPLISIQPRDGRGIIDLDAASLALIGVGEGQSPTTLAERGAQPQAHEVATGHAGVRAVVPVGGAGVQGVGVGDELDVADVEDHVQLDARADVLQRLERVHLLRRQGRDDAGVREARQAAHVVRVPFAIEALFFAFLWCLEVEDAGADVRVLALADLALAVEVPDGRGEQLGDGRVFVLQDVPDLVDAGDVGLAAFLGAGQAQQANDVGIIGVEELPRVRPVDPHLVDLRAVLPQVLHVAQDVALAVLRHRVPDVRAQSEVRHPGLVDAPFVHGKALVQDESFAVEQLVAHRLQARREVGQWEVARVDARQWMSFSDEGVCRLRELGDLLGREYVRPAFRVRRIVIGFPDRGTRDGLGEGAVGIELVVEWWVLARGFEAVGKDGEVDGFLTFAPERVGWHCSSRVHCRRCHV